MNTRVLFDLKVRAAFFDNDTKVFETHEAETVAVLVEKVKEDFQWMWDELEKNCVRVQLLFKGTHGYYTEDTTMAQVRLDCGSKGVSAVMVIEKEEESANTLEHDVYEFSVFNNLVQILVQGNILVDVVKDLVEKIKPILVDMGLKSYGKIHIYQGGSLLPYAKPLAMVPSGEVIYIQQVIDGPMFKRVMDVPIRN